MRQAFITTMLFILSLPVQAETMTRESPYSVTQTMERLENIVKEKGMTVFARIDHQKNAESVEMQMGEAQLLIFGAPKGGTLLMQQDITIGLDLPLKVLVYRNADQPTRIAYKEPLDLKELYQLENSAVLEKISAALSAMTAAASK